MVSYNFCRHSSKNYIEFLRVGITDFFDRVYFVDCMGFGEFGNSDASENAIKLTDDTIGTVKFSQVAPDGVN